MGVSALPARAMRLREMYLRPHERLISRDALLAVRSLCMFVRESSLRLMQATSP